MKKPEYAIELKGVTTRFGIQTVHDRLDLKVRKGEILALVGGSGTGKSVLMRHMVGLTAPQEGTISILGYEIGSQDDQIFRDKVGMLFQDGALFSSLTVLENIELPLKEQSDLDPSFIRELAQVKLALSGLPADAGHKYPSNLSGGMRKRAGLARALALDPEILFLDEPTAGLDPVGANAFDELILSIQRSLKLTVVMITHDLDSIYKATDRVAVLLDKKVRTGTYQEIQKMGHPWINEYFGGPRARAALSKLEKET